MSNEAIKDAVRKQLNETNQLDWPESQLENEINRQYIVSLRLMGAGEVPSGISVVRTIWGRVGPILCDNKLIVALIEDGTGDFWGMVVEVAAALSHVYAIDLACPLAVFFCRRGLKNLCRKGWHQE